MANKNIPDLTASEADLAAADLFEIYGAIPAANRKLTGTQLRNFISSLIQRPRFSRATWNRGFGSATGSDNTGTTQPSGINTLRAIPIQGGLPQAYDQIQAEVVTPVASSLFRMGVYKADPVTGYPTSLVYGTPPLSGATAQVVADPINPTITLSEAMYWLALFADSNITFRAIGGNGAADAYFPMGEIATMGGTLRQAWLTVAQAFGAMPANFPAGATINSTSSFMSKILLFPV